MYFYNLIDNYRDCKSKEKWVKVLKGYECGGKFCFNFIIMMIYMKMLMYVIRYEMRESWLDILCFLVLLVIFIFLCIWLNSMDFLSRVLLSIKWI